ncbi:MAG: DUF4838 domain-containing protein [Armatimonadetes bacterium]|nr:DUF4838 domain-containing protein [Armatimonadota bacterium]CUU37582.1 protein of unknown function (DUF4838) [Armatimonadetes bacterium DC]
MSLVIADRGRARMPILTQEGAIPAEVYASEELAHWLQQMTGAPFERVAASPESIPPAGIVVGQGSVARKLFPEVPFDRLGAEEIVILSKGRYLLLAGGRPRGTLYAVYQFLQRYGGIRWFAPWATQVPRRRTFRLNPVRVQESPAFEYREPFWYPAFDGDWAARNCVNGHRPSLTEKHGGKVEYVGFVHTFYWLVPPEQYFEKHPEWYSLIDGKRQWEKAQLCCTNPQLRKFLVERVRQILRENPQAQIISISQNDWKGACQCDACRAIDEREGTPCGSVLDMVNYIAERLEKEFPHVAFDTLAYWYTRKPTRTLRPRPNVIIRLCSIECSFAQPLEHPMNKDFADDIRGWSERSQRLYVWDYTTNFNHYILPHPNYFVLGANVRFFHRHGVRGLFEQGAYQSHGAEMAELRAWVLAQLMWNPYQDDGKLIDEFLKGYYGAAAPYIKQAMGRFAERAKDSRMGCFIQPKDAPYLDLETLTYAEQNWERAEQAVRHDPERLWRVQIGRLPIWYAWLVKWESLQEEARQKGKSWAPAPSRKALAQRWLERALAPGPHGWTPITHVNEWGTTPQKFVESLEAP